MPAATVSVYDILLQMARDLNLARYGRVSGVASGTGGLSLECATISSDTNYQWAWTRILGRGQAVADTYSTTNKVFTFTNGTLSTCYATTPAVGDNLEFAWWRADDLGDAMAAINRAITEAWPTFYREVVVAPSAGAITLDGITRTYDLSTPYPSMAYLFAIGLEHDDTTIEWIPPLDLWRVSGDEGAISITFYPNSARDIPMQYWGRPLGVHYAAREPLVTSERDTTELPLSYFSVASAYFAQARLADASRSELSTMNLSVPQLQQMASRGRATLKHLKRPLSTGPKYGYGVPT